MPPVKAARCCQHVCGFRYADDMRRLVAWTSMRVLIVEDEPYLAEAIRDGLRLEAIAADVAGDGDTALRLLDVNAYDIAVLDRDVPGPSGDEIAQRIVCSGSGMPILMFTAADRLDDKASGFEIGADDYLTKPFELRELVLRLRALDRRRAHHRPPVREIAGLRLDPFRREVYRDGRYVALTRKQFAVLEVLVAADGGVVSAEELLRRAWGQNADPEGVRSSVCEAGATVVMSVGESVSEVDLEAAQRGGPVVGAAPFALGSLDGEVDQFGGGLFVGEVAAGLDALADLAVEVLDAVGRVDRAAQLGGQCQEGDDVLPAGAPGGGDHGGLLAPLLIEGGERGLGGVGVDGAVDRPQVGRDLAPVGVGDEAHA